MLAALCDVANEVEFAVIHRLFQMGNVNVQAAQVRSADGDSSRQRRLSEYKNDLSGLIKVESFII